MVVGHQRDHPPALVRRGVEDDRAGLGDRDRAGGHHAVEPVDVGRGQAVVGHRAGQLPGQAGRHHDPRRAAARTGRRGACRPAPTERSGGPRPCSRPAGPPAGRAGRPGPGRRPAGTPAAPRARAGRSASARRIRPSTSSRALLTAALRAPGTDPAPPDPPPSAAAAGPGGTRTGRTRTGRTRTGGTPDRGSALTGGGRLGRRVGVAWSGIRGCGSTSRGSPRPAAPAGRGSRSSRTAAAATPGSGPAAAEEATGPGCRQRDRPPARRPHRVRDRAHDRPFRRRMRHLRRAGARASSGCRSPPGRRRSRPRTARTRTAGSAFSADPGQLRREDRPDRPRVHRPVRVPAGPLVDRADVQAGRAADAAQRRAAGRVAEHRRPPVVQQHQVEVLRPRPTPDHIDVYGFIRSPVDERGSSCRNTSRSGQVGTSFSMPITVIRVRGSVRHIRPLPSDSTTDQRAGRRRPRSWRRRSPPGRSGTSAAGAGAPPRPARPRLVGEVGRRRQPDGPSRAGRSPGSRPGCGGSPAPGCATACRARAARSARPGRSPRPRSRPPASASLSPISWVAIDLTLTTSSAPVARTSDGDDRGSPRRRRGPSARCRRAR